MQEASMARWAAALKGVLPGRSGNKDAQPNAEATQHRTNTNSNASDTSGSEQHTYAPVVWLLGKVQSGKTSVIRAITRSSDAAIGDGFRPCTRTARLYAFPNDMPV